MNSFQKEYEHRKRQNHMLKRYILAASLILMAAVLFLTGCSVNKYLFNSDTSRTESGNGTEKEMTANISDWNLILVNSWNPIPADFTVELIQLSNGQSVDKRIYDDLQAMLDAARDEGVSPLICSSYRTNEKQQTLYDNEVKQYLTKGYSQKEAETKAGKWVAVPGTSEHQTGLAVDIVDLNYQILDEGQEQTPVQKWLMSNSYQYGFILRYPNDKSDITGINYEPWHYRYVGKKQLKRYTNKECTSPKRKLSSYNFNPRQQDGDFSLGLGASRNL